eukprot:389799-Pelagomonas_calceolata.AAC.1
MQHHGEIFFSIPGGEGEEGLGGGGGLTAGNISKHNAHYSSYWYELQSSGMHSNMHPNVYLQASF